MAIRYSINSEIPNQIGARYTVNCPGSATTGHTDHIGEAYEAAAVLARRALLVRKMVTVTVRYLHPTGQQQVVATITYDEAQQ
jgi:hypothetical protein